MKILFISATFPIPQLPRQGAYNRTLVDALRVEHDVRVIAPIPWTLSRRASSTSCEQHPIYYYPPKLFRPHYHHFFEWSIQGSVRKLRRQFEPDIVLSNWLHPDGAASICVARQMGVPAVIVAGGSDLRLLTKQPARRRAIARACRHADRLIVVSQELATHALRLGVSPEKLEVIMRGVDRAVFKPLDRCQARQQIGIDVGARVVFWAGRLETVKQPLMLLNAARIWKKHFGDSIRVLLAGDGALRGAIEQARAQLGLENTVALLGSVSQDQLALLYNAADLTVLTSSSEGTPNVLLESICCGTPFVATDVGGVSAIATTGIDRLVPAGDCQAFTAAVLDMLNNPLRDSQRSHPRQFDPSDLQQMSRKFEASLVLALQQFKATTEAPPRLDAEVSEC